jgi:hypothetical protein
MTGRTQPETQKQKKSKSLLEWYENNEVSEETRKQIGKKVKEAWANTSEETKREIRQKISATLTGRILPEEHRNKVVKNLIIGSKDEHSWVNKPDIRDKVIMKMRKANNGIVRSEEFKQNVSAGMLAYRKAQREQTPTTKLYLAKCKSCAQ